MHLRLFDYVLWFGGTLMQLGVLVAMYRRGLHRDYPYFFNYTVLQVLSEPILFVVQKHSYATYYWSYWVSVALSALISFGVLQEIFHDAFRPWTAPRLSLLLQLHRPASPERTDPFCRAEAFVRNLLLELLGCVRMLL